MDSEYPKMLFREGTEIKWEGKDLDTRVVETVDEELSAREDGWLGHDEIHAPAPEPKRKTA